MVVLEIINMVMKDQGQVIKVPTLGPNDGYVGNKWPSLNAKKNPKCLTYSGKQIYCFGVALSEGGGGSATAFKILLLGFILSLVVRGDELVIMLILEVLQNYLSLFHFLEETEIFVLLTPISLESRAGKPNSFLVLLPL